MKGRGRVGKEGEGWESKGKGGKGRGGVRKEGEGEEWERKDRVEKKGEPPVTSLFLPFCNF